MKKIIPALFFYFIFTSLSSSAQPLRKMQESQNFYEIKSYYEQLFKNFENKTEATPSPAGESEEAEQDNAWKIFKRWENFYEPRVYPSGEMNYEQNIFEEFLKIKNHASTTRNDVTDENWTLVGPNTVPAYGGIGRINAVGFNPDNPNVVWVGTPSGGLWKSADAGTTWTTNTDLLPVLGVSEIVIDPSDTDVMYIAMGDRDAGDTQSIGILKSTDGGVTWNTTGLSYTIYDFSAVRRILIDPQQTNILVAATSSGIYKTEDGGTTWTQTQAGDFWDLEFKPSGNDSTMYACDGSNFYISVNLGSSWVLSSNGLPSSGTGRMSLAVSPANPQYVYLLLTNYYDWGFEGLYRSTNGGASWNEMSASPNLLGWEVDGSDVGGQGWYTLSLAADPDNANVIYVGGVDIWKSQDGGATWSIVAHWYGANGTPYVHADIHDIVTRGNNTAYTVCDGGIFKTSDGGSSWNDLSNGGLAISQFYRFSNAATDSNFILAGAQDNGTSRLKNNSWREVYGGDGMEALVDFTSTDIVYAESQGGYVGRSFNGGTYWVGITPGTGGAWVTPYIIDPNSHSHLIYGGSEVYLSNDYGNNWFQSTSGQTNGVDYQSLAIAPSNSSVIYAATYTQLLKTIDGGSSWADITGHLPAALPAITYIAVKSTDENTLWITCSGFAAGQKVFQSIDGGNSWQNISAGIPNIPANCIVYKEGTNDELYVGTDVGVYYKEKYLSNWIPVNNGLPNVIVDELEIQYESGKLRAATFGRGIWQTNLVTPIYYEVDANLLNVAVPSGLVCTSSVNPQVTIKNYGLDAITSLDLNYHIDNNSVSTYNFSGNIPSLGTQTITLPSVTIDPGIHTFYASTSSPNGSADEFPANDLDSSTYTLVAPGVVPVHEGFETSGFPPADWQLQNFDNSITWHKTNVSAFGNGDSSMMIDLYFYPSIGQLDNMFTPKLDFSSFGSNILLTFDVASARYTSDYNDSLFVLTSIDCGTSWTKVYSKGGETLSTAPDQTYPFTPTSGEWRHEEVDLSSYYPQQVIIEFQSRNGYSNDLYIDNININDEPLSVTSASNNQSIFCYPNPANDQLHIGLNNVEDFTGSIMMQNTLGEIVYQKNISSTNNYFNQSISVDALPPGMYSIILKSRDKVWEKKVIISR